MHQGDKFGSSFWNSFGLRKAPFLLSFKNKTFISLNSVDAVAKLDLSVWLDWVSRKIINSLLSTYVMAFPRQRTHGWRLTLNCEAMQYPSRNQKRWNRNLTSANALSFLATVSEEVCSATISHCHNVLFHHRPEQLRLPTKDWNLRNCETNKHCLLSKILLPVISDTKNPWPVSRLYFCCYTKTQPDRWCILFPCKTAEHTSPQHANAFHGRLLFSGYLVICAISVAICSSYWSTIMYLNRIDTERYRMSNFWTILVSRIITKSGALAHA